MSGISFTPSISTFFETSDSTRLLPEKKSGWSDQDLADLKDLYQETKYMPHPDTTIQRKMIEKNPTLTPDSIRGRINTLKRLDQLGVINNPTIIEKNKWTREDLNSLKPLYDKHKGSKDWLLKIQKEMIEKNPTLTPNSIATHVRNLLKKKSTPTMYWTSRENDLLKEIIEKYSNQNKSSKINWAPIVQEFNLRTGHQLSSKNIRGHFHWVMKSSEKQPSSEQIQPNFQEFSQISSSLSPLPLQPQDPQQAFSLELTSQTPVPSVTLPPAEEQPQIPESQFNCEDFFSTSSSQETLPFQLPDEQDPTFQELSYPFPAMSQPTTFPMPVIFNEPLPINTQNSPVVAPTENREMLKQSSIEKVEAIKRKILAATHDLQEALFECMEFAGQSQPNEDENNMDWLLDEIRKARSLHTLLND